LFSCTTILPFAPEGAVSVQVVRSRTPGSREILSEAPLPLTPEGARIDLGALLGASPTTNEGGPLPPQDGLVSLRLAATDAPARIDAGGYLAGAGGARDVRLAIAVTTFRREAEIAATAARVSAFVDQGGVPGAEIRLYVIDNGGTADPASHPAVTLVGNPNLGGAGGFARGLAEATDWGASHVLFMDDDATFQMESLARAIAFLRLARSDRAAVSGAMISEARKWAMWENGAVFHRMCRPQFVGTDLRDPHQVARMELAAARPKPPGFYAGWWFFAFPVAAAAHWPFPFFVRGDDISFSLANRFDTVTLNGVVSFQEDFSAKESGSRARARRRRAIRLSIRRTRTRASMRTASGIRSAWPSIRRGRCTSWTTGISGRTRCSSCGRARTMAGSRRRWAAAR
jgi:GT2 family glycosyltransferase